MNKRGKMAPGVTILIVVAVLAILAISFVVVRNEVISPTTPGAGGSVTDCETAPNLGFSVVNALQKGSGVTVLESIRLNGVLQTPGVVPAAFQYDDEVEVLYNASNYLDNIGALHKMTCGKNTLNNEIYATDDPTIRIFNTDGNRIGNCLTAVTAVNALVNQSSSATAINMKVEIQSAPLQSSGDLVLIVECDNSTEVGFSDITLSGTGVTDASVPSTYTNNATISTVRAFNVPASVNGALTTYYLNLNPKSGQTIGATGSAGTYCQITTESKQAFIDVDGTFQTGVVNANGVAQYEDIATHGIAITA
jgi:hypothetical protein